MRISHPNYPMHFSSFEMQAFILPVTKQREPKKKSTVKVKKFTALELGSFPCNISCNMYYWVQSQWTAVYGSLTTAGTCSIQGSLAHAAMLS